MDSIAPVDAKKSPLALRLSSRPAASNPTTRISTASIAPKGENLGGLSVNELFLVKPPWMPLS